VKATVNASMKEYITKDSLKRIHAPIELNIDTDALKVAEEKADYTGEKRWVEGNEE